MSSKFKSFTVPTARMMPVIILADVSGSMTKQGKIAILNRAIASMIQEFKDDNPMTCHYLFEESIDFTKYCNDKKFHEKLDSLGCKFLMLFQLYVMQTQVTRNLLVYIVIKLNNIKTVFSSAL